MSKLAAVLLVLLSAVSWAQYPPEYQPKNYPGAVKKRTPPPTGTANAGQTTDDLNVQRKGGATPEAKLASASVLTTGGSHEVTVDLINIDPAEVKGVRGFGACKNVSNFRAVPPSQIKFTVTIPGNIPGAGCDLALQDVRARTIRTVYVQVITQEEARRRAEQERQRKEHEAQMEKMRKESEERMAPYKAQADANLAAAKKADLGTVWTVTFGNGKRRETWRFVRVDTDGIVRIFSNGNREIKIMLNSGMIMVADEQQQCTMQGFRQGNTVSGQMMGYCPEGNFARWSATIQ